MYFNDSNWHSNTSEMAYPVADTVLGGTALAANVFLLAVIVKYPALRKEECVSLFAVLASTDAFLGILRNIL